VVPIAIHGSARIRNWKRLQFPTVTVRYGEAICWERIADPTRDQQRAVAEAILEEIRTLHAGLRSGARPQEGADRLRERVRRRLLEGGSHKERGVG